MLKSTILFIGLLNEVVGDYPELSMSELKEVATYILEEPEFSGNTEIVEFINIEMANIKPAMLHCKKAAYDIGLRPGGV